MLVDGTIVMVIGMGSVFIFLLIMVALIRVMTRIMKLFPGQSPVLATAAGFSANPGSSNTTEELAVVIAAAKAFAAGEQK